MKSGWIGVDLDGTLAYYDGWKGANHIGEPVLLMLGRVKDWLAEGKDIRIFTARISIGGAQGKEAKRHIESWCLKHIGRVLPVVCCKDFNMLTLYDDRCVQVEENAGVLITK